MEKRGLGGGRREPWDADSICLVSRPTIRAFAKPEHVHKTIAGSNRTQRVEHEPRGVHNGIRRCKAQAKSLIRRRPTCVCMQPDLPRVQAFRSQCRAIRPIQDAVTETIS
eukprot:1622361-Rhodomonas_salina.1